MLKYECILVEYTLYRSLRYMRYGKVHRDGNKPASIWTGYKYYWYNYGDEYLPSCDGMVKLC